MTASVDARVWPGDRRRGGSSGAGLRLDRRHIRRGLRVALGGLVDFDSRVRLLVDPRRLGRRRESGIVRGGSCRSAGETATHLGHGKGLAGGRVVRQSLVRGLVAARRVQAAALGIVLFPDGVRPRGVGGGPSAAGCRARLGRVDVF